MGDLITTNPDGTGYQWYSPPAGSWQSPTQFSSAVLSSIGGSQTNAGLVNAWQAAEGQWAATGKYNAVSSNNPLNTTLVTSGSSPLAQVSGNTYVQSYPTQQAGVAATVQTLNDPRYAQVVADLRTPGTSLAKFAADVGASGWGTDPNAIVSQGQNPSVLNGLFGVVGQGTGPSQGGSNPSVGPDANATSITLSEAVTGAGTSWLVTYNNLLGQNQSLLGSLNIVKDFEILVARAVTVGIGFAFLGVGLVMMFGGAIMDVLFGRRSPARIAEGTVTSAAGALAK